ncbi:unnamed protein product, partial [Linum tenue]
RKTTGKRQPVNLRRPRRRQIPPKPRNLCSQLPGTAGELGLGKGHRFKPISFRALLTIEKRRVFEGEGRRTKVWSLE